jgi:peroxiredoxin
MIRATVACVAILWGASLSMAGEFNPTLNIGSEAPAWSKLPGADGKTHSLDDLKSKDVVVVVFTCNSCPYARDYEGRMMDFVKKHGGPDGKAALVAINVNKVAEDSLEKMTARAKEVGFNYPYLFDETQKIAKDYGATSTPEFFVLNKDREVVYMGAMDDNADVSKAKVSYVEEAVAAALKGESPKTKETAAVGCLVRYVKDRKKK